MTLDFDDIKKLITTANIAIKKHNDIVDNFANERNKLINEIWKFIIEDNQTRMDFFVKHKNGLQKGIDNIT